MSDDINQTNVFMSPAIIRKVGLHLSRSQLTQCLRVCSTWRRVLEPLLWETLTLQNQPCNHVPRQPTPTLCLRNRHHIRHLVETGSNSLLKFLAFSTTPRPLRLTSIRVTLLSPEILMIIQQNIDTLVSFSCRSNRLRKGEADQEAQSLWHQQLFMVLEMVPQLRELSIGPAVLLDSPVLVLSKVAHSLKSLELDRVKVADRTLYEHPERAAQEMSSLALFPELETLTVIWNDLVPQCQLEIIRKAPKLKSLTWKRGTRLLVQSWLDSTLPPPTTLTMLDIAHSHTSDEEMARILTLTPRLTELIVRSTPFGPHSYAQLLDRYAANMTVLDISDCTQVTSKMVMDLMSSMPSLLRFSASGVEAEDIAKLYLYTTSTLGQREKEELSSSLDLRPWVCLNLIELDISIVGLRACQNFAPTFVRSLIYSQLSELRNLETLWLKEKDISTMNEGEECLDLALAHDLNKLAGLKKLKTLDVRQLRTRIAA
ncbi:hypothetical protein FBU30_003249 [Linnemannia zychae]|nr:hypothetical protein FBU30_003249 [Linnemannia zychae]